MATGNNDGMFKRLTRLMTAPARDVVATQPARDTDIRSNELDKAEMKAMIERKRRNDYVRKRELDMLRRIRREGLSAEQAASLTLQSSRMDDSEVRSTQPSTHSIGIKAKIDAIERQMVGASSGVTAGGGKAGRSTSTSTSASQPGPPPPILTATIFGTDGDPTVPVALVSDHGRSSRLPSSRGLPPRDGGIRRSPSQPGPASGFAPTRPPPDGHAAARRAAAPASHVPTAAVPLADTPQNAVDLGNREWVEVNEIEHDATLDEPVIAFASGDFEGCEAALHVMVGPRGERRDSEDTWLVLFDFYRAIGQQGKFETLSADFTDRFRHAAPRWFSLPRQLAEAGGTPQVAEDRKSGGVGWVCPARLDVEEITRLDALSMQLPEPWLLDWAGLQAIDVDAAARLRKLMAIWAGQPRSMRWVSGERLLGVLQEQAPTGVRDADPVFWMLRLEALRLAHRPDQFDEVAIDYCVTYEVSPPSWEKPLCTAHMLGSAPNTRQLTLSVVGDAVMSVQDSDDDDDTRSQVRVSSVELSGQLAGDIGELLQKLVVQAGDAQVIRISCALLMRVDFVAAGDLLNWVQARRSEGREIVFHELHRLVALMFGAMGITELARVQLRHG